MGGLFRLEDSDILLRGSPSAIHVRNLRRCKVFAGPVSGSIFIDKCEDCVFVLSCQQLRIHSTKETSFYIHVTSKPSLKTAVESVLHRTIWITWVWTTTTSLPVWTGVAIIGLKWTTLTSSPQNPLLQTGGC